MSENDEIIKEINKEVNVYLCYLEMWHMQSGIMDAVRRGLDNSENRDERNGKR